MTDQGSEGHLSPYLRKKRFSATIPHIRGKVLDFGCGTGMLAGFISPDKYFGVEIAVDSLAKAKLRFPEHIFSSELPVKGERFDTVVSLAVIEHIRDPIEMLQKLSAYMKDSHQSDCSQIILTTPIPSMGLIHDVGSAMGIFSKSANEEHEHLLDRKMIEDVARKAGLKVFSYRRFLFGANQLIILHKS